MESDFSRFQNLVDIQNIAIPEQLTPEEKKREYLRQTGSSTMHKVGEITVKCVYGDMTLEKMLADIICG